MHQAQTGGTGKLGAAVPDRRKWNQSSPARDGSGATTRTPEGRPKFSRTRPRSTLHHSGQSLHQNTKTGNPASLRSVHVNPEPSRVAMVLKIILNQEVSAWRRLRADN